MSAVDHPEHYNGHPSGVECITVVEHMGFNLGNAVKYIWRADLKGAAIEDLEKARWYVEREIAKRRGDNQRLPFLEDPVLLSDGQVVQGAVYDAQKAMFDALGVKPIYPRGAQTQLATLSQALTAAKAEIAALRQDQANAARKLEIDAFEAETNRLKAMQR